MRVCLFSALIWDDVMLSLDSNVKGAKKLKTDWGWTDCICDCVEAGIEKGEKQVVFQFDWLVVLSSMYHRLDHCTNSGTFPQGKEPSHGFLCQQKASCCSWNGSADPHYVSLAEYWSSCESHWKTKSMLGLKWTRCTGGHVVRTRNGCQWLGQNQVSLAKYLCFVLFYFVFQNVGCS